MPSRIIVSRDIRKEHYAAGIGDDMRPQLAAEITQVASDIAACWVRLTRSADMISAPVALQTIRYPDRKGRGYIEIAWMSRPRLIYPLRNTIYGFGIDASGALYDYVPRRNMAFTEDVRYWAPMGDIAGSRYSTAVLSHYLLPFLGDMAHH
jgi:hypothetical protein